MPVLIKASSSVFYLYGVNFWDLEELREVLLAEELAESTEALLYDPPHNMNFQRELEWTE